MSTLPVLRDALQPGSRAREQARRLGRLLARLRRPDARESWRTEPTPVSRLPSQQDLLPTALASLALRDLTLVETLLRLVEELEEKEEDPEQLDVLFRIDHLATRMRRNGENLLVLAGQDTGHDRPNPVRLLDVARAAISEITEYQRAEAAGLPDVRVAGIAADDISHLLAELLDNATSKSPRHTQVLVSARVIADGTVVVSVEDSGIGIPVQRLAELNARLEGPPVLDVGITRHMGLYVVAMLAHRHGVRVQLQARPFGGTTAYVVLPSHLVHMEPHTRVSAAASSPVSFADESGSRTESRAGRPDNDGADQHAAPLGPRPVPAAERDGEQAATTTAAGLPKRTPGASVGFLTATGLSDELPPPTATGAPPALNDGEPGFVPDEPEAVEPAVEPEAAEPADDHPEDALSEQRSEDVPVKRDSWGVHEAAGVRAPEHTGPLLGLGLSTAEQIRADLGGFEEGQNEARSATNFHPVDDGSEMSGTDPDSSPRNAHRNDDGEAGSSAP